MNHISVYDTAFKFVPTYHEWELLVFDHDGNHHTVYAWDDFSEDIPEDMTMDDANNIADELFTVMEMSREEDGSSFDKDTADIIKKVMATAIYFYYA